MSNTSKLQQPIQLGILPADPVTAEAGSIYFNTTFLEFRAYNGLSWETVGTAGGGGANTALSNLTTTSINQNLIPATDLTRNIGSPAATWDMIYATTVASKPNTFQVTVTGDLTNSSNTIENVNLENMNYVAVGQEISSPDLSPGTVIAGIDRQNNQIYIIPGAQATTIGASLDVTINIGLLLETAPSPDANPTAPIIISTGEGQSTGSITIQSGKTLGMVRGSVFADASSLYLRNATPLVFAQSDNLLLPNTVNISLGALSESYNLYLPIAQGASSQALLNDGNGQLYWGSSGLPSGQDTIVNNSSGLIAGLQVPLVSGRSVTVDFSLHRKTDDNEIVTIGKIRAWRYDDDSYSITSDYSGDDSGLTFTIDGSGNIGYTSSNLTGANYSGQMKYVYNNFSSL